MSIAELLSLSSLPSLYSNFKNLGISNIIHKIMLYVCIIKAYHMTVVNYNISFGHMAYITVFIMSVGHVAESLHASSLELGVL